MALPLKNQFKSLTMKTTNRNFKQFWMPLLMAAGTFGSAAIGADRVDYNRDIRPILSDTCYKCHGPDQRQRQASLRLDTEQGATQKLESDHIAIVAGDISRSELYRRISSKDPDERMPPADSGKKLTSRQIELIRRWIEQGAQWQRHWSFLPPKRPKIDGANLSPIDILVRARLIQEGLKPSSPAAKTTLIRRVTFDLTGLPPTLKDIDNFLVDGSDNAYERVVDRLLKSTRYGEHMSRFWLDAARYGDTHGLHLDNERSLWPYRDWVINAFNNNMPFDQFTVEQLAGDLLPNPTLQQKLATGFNRCNVTTSEGGSIAEEYRVRYAVDRVETTATVWMGLTVGCAVCHEHKFDPISQKEFYQLFAYFSSVNENPMDGNALLPPPTMKVPTKEQQQRKRNLQAKLPPLRQTIKAKVAEIKYEEPKPGAAQQPAEPTEFVWIEDSLPSGAKAQTSGNGTSGWSFVGKPGHPVYSGARSSIRTCTGLGQHFFTEATPPLKVGQDDKLFAYVYLDPKNPPKEIMLQWNDGKSWEHRAIWGENLINWGKQNSPSRLPLGKLPKSGEWVRLEITAAKVGLGPGSSISGWAFTQFDGTVHWDKAGIVSMTRQGGTSYKSLVAWESVQKKVAKSPLPKPIQAIIKLDRTKRNAVQQKQLQDYFVEHVYAGSRKVLRPLHQKIADVERKLGELDKQIPSTMIMKEMDKPRDTFVLVRGQYEQPDKNQQVFPNVPQMLSTLPKDAPPNRLGLARWLVDRSHPLTARVIVNRFWQQYFGTGIVKTAEDFGAQGEWPSHPELLDWLAVEFIESGWNVKQLQKQIVMSATYSQSSKVTPQHLEKDPENRLLARGPRFRLDAEMVRDNALVLSNLLIDTIGGKSVKPYQPDGLWRAVGYSGSNTVKFVQDHGEKLYRRSLYTFWKRTSPPPSMSTLDAPSRESCMVRRERTNTPLQALLLMNDVQFVEAARKMAERVMRDGGSTPADRVRFAFRLATSRHPDNDERDVFLQLYRANLNRYKRNTQAAAELLSVGEAKRDEALDSAELAAWTIISNLILNLDETLTKG